MKNRKTDSRGISRRQFLKSSLYGATWFAAGGSALLVPGKTIASGTPDIGVAKGSPKAATRAAVELMGGMKRFVKPGNQVVIKPNMSFPTGPERASNTHPEVVEAISAMCREAGAKKVLILDHTLGPAEKCIENSQIQAVCNQVYKDSVFAVNDDDHYVETRIPEGKTMKKTDVMKALLESDVLIAAPVAKSHSSAGVSLSMKGMMGLIYDRRVMHWRHDLDEAIVDLCTLIRPKLVVVDATRVLSTGGPGGPGKVLKPDTVIASENMVSADALAVASFEWYGRKMQPRQVGHIRIAHERGLGRMDVENLNIRRVTV